MATLLGIDIGGSGIKGAPVDVRTGELLTPRYRIPTPDGAQPDEIADVVAALAEHFDWTGRVGVAFPAVIEKGTVCTASNIDESWIGVDAAQLLGQRLSAPVTMVNDADAAGLAEMRFGAGRGRMGTVMVLTFGTGIGSALFTDGVLVRNTELGQLEIRGRAGERRAAASVRDRKQLSWRQWAARVDEYLTTIERLFWPDLVIIGGGVSKRHDEFFGYLHTAVEIVPAALRNDAGIIGAAMHAAGGVATVTGEPEPHGSTLPGPR